MNTNITIICNNIQNGLYSYGYLIMFISLPNQIELILMLISSESYLVISIYIQYIPYLLNYKTFIIINLDNYLCLVQSQPKDIYLKNGGNYKIKRFGYCLS